MPLISHKQIDTIYIFSWILLSSGHLFSRWRIGCIVNVLMETHTGVYIECFDNKKRH